jgi:hypothetical protein
MNKLILNLILTEPGKALKMRAVQDNKRFSKVAEDALRQYLGIKEKIKKQPR